MKNLIKGLQQGVAVLGALFLISSVVMYWFDLGSTVGRIAVITVYVVTQLFVIFFTAYQTLISAAGLFINYIRKEKNNVDVLPQKTFALIVCAHNEEVVVGDIVTNLVNDMQYPKEMYDVYVICDNCTDGTADIVRQHGGIAMERYDLVNKGKGYGLEWMFNNLWAMESYKSYDAICVFDADNLVTPNFMVEMNRKLIEGHDVVQAYLDTKNPKDSWISKSYAVSYWATNRTFQKIREYLGLSAQLGGTGMCMSTHILRTIGWGAESLTEDLEFTAKYVMHTGKPVAWSHEAKILDEKPIELQPTMKQRTRWMIGHINCAMSQGWDVFKEAVRKRSLLHFDIFVYLVQPSRVVMSVVHIGFWTASVFKLLPGDLGEFTIESWGWFALLVASYGIPYLGLLLEKRKLQEVLYLIPGYLFALTWLPIVISGIKRRKEREWNPTKHTRTVSTMESTDIINVTVPEIPNKILGA